MDEIYEAYMSLRLHDQEGAFQACDNILKKSLGDGRALLVQMQAVIEDCYFDETEFEEAALEDIVDQTKLGGVVPDLSLPTSFRPSSRLQTGMIRPLTAAIGRAGARGSSRLGSAAVGAGVRLETARLGSAAGKERLSRLGSALKHQNEDESLRSLQNLPVSLGSRPLFRRIVPNFYLRLLPSRLLGGPGNDITPDPQRALQFLRMYSEAQQSSGQTAADWFFNDRAGRAFYLLRAFQEAERHFNAALRLVPREKTALKVVNCVAARRGATAAADLLERQRQIYTQSAGGALQRARLAELLGDHTRARSNYVEVLQLTKGCEEAVAGAAYLAEDPEEQLTLYKKLLTLRPWDPAVWVNVAGTLAALHRAGEAFQYYVEAWARAQQLQNTSLAGLKESSSAVRRHLGVKASIAYGTGCLFAQIADFQAAQEAFELARFLDPELPEALTNLGVLAHMTGQVARAMQLFRRAAEIGCPVAKENLAVLAVELGDLETAMYAGRSLEDLQ